MISSAIPSQRYSWSFAALMSENGSTAIATVPAARVGAPASAAPTSSPALPETVHQVFDELGVPTTSEAPRALRA